MSRRHVAFAVGAVLLAGCPIGPRTSTFEPAQRPQGISCLVQLRGRPDSAFTGELLALQDTAAVLVVQRTVWLAPFRTIRSSNCRRAGAIPFRQNGTLNREYAALHVRLSRYPQGLSPELLAALLAAYQQNEPYVVPQR